jgi:hypothetical protein
MSPQGRPKGEYRSAQREGITICPQGRSKGEHRSAEREGIPMNGNLPQRQLVYDFLAGCMAPRKGPGAVC